MKKITWTIEMGNATMGSPFAVGETHKHHGKWTKITSVKEEGAKVTFEGYVVEGVDHSRKQI